MDIYVTLASLTFATIDIIAFEMLLAAIFITKDGQIKITMDYLFGISTYRKTHYYVFSVILIGIIYFYSSNFIQDQVVSYLSLSGIKTIPSFIASIGFASFWLTKITLGRRWEFPLVWGSGLVTILSLILLMT